MSWNFQWIPRKDKKYGVYKQNFRKKGKSYSKYVYLGNEKTAMKILNDFQKNNFQQEQVYTYSGEILLKEIADRLKFTKIVNSYNYGTKKWDIGLFIETLVIERAMSPTSKWSLAHKVYKRSILSLRSSIPITAFYENNIYNYMDYVHPFLHDIQSKLVEQIYRLFPSDNETLILDGTSLYAHKADSDPTFELQSDSDESIQQEEQVPDLDQPLTSRTIARLFGYSRDKRPDLPQINLMLGVNQRQIPLYFEVYAGNTIDLIMFQHTLSRLHTSYKGLLRRMKRKFMIFDRGNLSSENEEWLNQFCKKWDLYFIGGMLSSLVKNELQALQIEELPTIFKQNQTELYGQMIEKTVYNRRYKLLLYVSKSVRKHKLLVFQEKLEKVQSLLAEVSKDTRISDVEKVHIMKDILRTSSMIQLFELQKFDRDGVIITPIEQFPTDKLYKLIAQKVEYKKMKLRAEKRSLKDFEQKLVNVIQLLKEITEEDQLSDFQKVQEMKLILKKHSMVRLFVLKQFQPDGLPVPPPQLMQGLYQLQDQKILERKQLFGKFALITNHFSLTAEETMHLYKTKEKVEHEFHILKDLLVIRPYFHNLPHRIETHNAIVQWGMLFLSVLKAILEDNGLVYSFETLVDILRHGSLQKAIFSYPEFRTYERTQLFNFTPEVKQIFKIFSLKPQKFNIREITKGV